MLKSCMFLSFQVAEKQNQYKRYRKEYDAARKVRIITPEFVDMTSEKSHSFVD